MTLPQTALATIAEWLGVVLVAVALAWELGPPWAIGWTGLYVMVSAILTTLTDRR